jgi:hypothetical protein
MGLLFATIAAALCGVAGAAECLGEFEVCATGECVLDASFCGICKSAGEYLCQDSATCVANAAAVLTCPVIAPLYNTTLTIPDRVSGTVALLSLEEKAALIVMQSPVSMPVVACPGA